MRLHLILTMTGLLLLTGCMQYRVVSNGWEDLEQLARQTGSANVPSEPGAAQRQAELSGYTVELERFDGRRRAEKAEELVRLVRRELGYDGAWVLDRDGVARVMLGQFANPADPMAQLMRDDVRRIVVDDRTPFAEVQIVPISGKTSDHNPHNAANYPGFYTLQIGFYDAEFEGDRHAAAEKAVDVLRDEGEEAYFYHGPNLSLVCVGLFTQRDFVRKGDGRAEVDAYGPRIKALQEKYPHNLGNGRTVEESIAGKELGAQASCVVRIF